MQFPGLGSVSLDTAKMAVDTVALLTNQVQISFERGGHIEDLLLGLVTISVAGWAFLHAREKKAEESNLLGRLI